MPRIPSPLPPTSPPPSIRPLGSADADLVVHANLLDAIGRTPLVRLNRLASHSDAQVLVKLEYLNPGGSVKDRAARAMIDDAEATGDLGPGGTIVEGTSGNTGVGLAQAAAIKGYRIITVVPDKISGEKLDLLRAYGADVVVTTAGLPRDHPDHVANIAQRIAERTPGAWLANQYDNPANPRAHRETTGPEIWEATAGKVTHFVAGIGTGGTITGAGEYLKRISAGVVRVIGADPVTSVYSGGDGSPFFVEAAGHYLHPESVEDVWPRSYNPATVDEVLAVSDREAILTTRRLASHEGMMVGGSAGLAVAAGLRVAAALGPEHTVVVLAPDSGRGYLSKYHSTTWVRQFGFLDDDRQDLLGQSELTGPVGTVPADLSAAQALSELAGSDSQQPFWPVVLSRPDLGFGVAISEVVGTVDRTSLAAFAAADETRALRDIVGPVTDFVGTGETAAEALDRLGPSRSERRLVLLRDGRLAGVTTVGALAEIAARQSPASRNVSLHDVS